ncbi:MAG TPA: hypothetical protein VFR60_11165 [Sphingomicrobium sp.]|nr:hypothetical protein [Sphingomicrobium sp.]
MTIVDEIRRQILHVRAQGEIPTRIFIPKAREVELTQCFADRPFSTRESADVPASIGGVPYVIDGDELKIETA